MTSFECKRESLNDGVAFLAVAEVKYFCERVQGDNFTPQHFSEEKNNRETERVTKA